MVLTIAPVKEEIRIQNWMQRTAHLKVNKFAVAMMVKEVKETKHSAHHKFSALVLMEMKETMIQMTAYHKVSKFVLAMTEEKMMTMMKNTVQKIIALKMMQQVSLPKEEMAV